MCIAALRMPSCVWMPFWWSICLFRWIELGSLPNGKFFQVRSSPSQGHPSYLILYIDSPLLLECADARRSPPHPCFLVHRHRLWGPRAALSPAVAGRLPSPLDPKGSLFRLSDDGYRYNSASGHRTAVQLLYRGTTVVPSTTVVQPSRHSCSAKPNCSSQLPPVSCAGIRKHHARGTLAREGSGLVQYRTTKYRR